MKWGVHDAFPFGIDSAKYFNSRFFICQLSEMSYILRMHSFAIMGDSEGILPGLIHTEQLNFTRQWEYISKYLSLYNNAAGITSLRYVFSFLSFL